MIVIEAYIVLGLIFILISYGIWKKSGISERTKRFQVLFFVLFFLLFFLRVFKVYSILGIDADEAMGALNSWSLGKYGIDYFNLFTLPVYLYAWGSGMNILYPLITIPFVKYIGLNIIAYRTPLIVINILAISIFAFSLLKSKWTNRNIFFCLMIIFMSPGTIINSRWAVESNLFPPLIYIATACFILYKYNNKKQYFYCYNIILALSAYSYSNYWIFLTLFVGITLFWQFQQRNVNIYDVVITGIGYVTIELPLILFLVANYVVHKNIFIGKLSIPCLDATRSVFMPFNVSSILTNISEFFKMLILGYDGNLKMGIPLWGEFLPFMLTFSLIGLIFLLLKRTMLDKYMLIMLVALIPNILFIKPSWLHLNIILFPLLYFEYKGVINTFKTKSTQIVFTFIFMSLLTIYGIKYSSHYVENFQNGQNNTPLELEKLINKANQQKKGIYIVASYQKDETLVNSLYVLPLFYEKISPYYFKELTKEVKPAEFRSIYDFGKWHIREMDTFNSKSLTKGSICIMQNKAIEKGKNKNLILIKKSKFYSMFKVR